MKKTKRIKVFVLTIALAISMGFTACTETDNVTAPDLPMTQAVEKMIKNGAGSYEKYAYEVMMTLAYNFSDDATGFRTSGSDAEKEAADWIASEFEKVGLTGVEKVPVTVDKWQFNDATFKMTYTGKDGKAAEINLTNAKGEIGSYAASGTKQSGKNIDWNNLEIVDVGDGTKWGYDEARNGNENPDFFKNKVVMAGVSQNDDYWIGTYYTEAYVQGAAALITYQRVIEEGEYGGGMYNAGDSEEDWDTVIVQDMESFDYDIPCIAISPRDANKIKSALEENAANKGVGPAKVELFVDNIIEHDQIAYNVIGKIKGSGNTGQRILYAGHYDKYFRGFQDDSSAIGMVFGIAKAMVDSGYEPVNDIVFVAHCAEEWGQEGAEFVWAAGSWKLMTEAKPEWSGSTLGIMNYEECAGKIEDTVKLSGSFEVLPMLQGFLDADLLRTYKGKVHPTITGVSGKYGSAECDEVSYELNGVPIFSPAQASPGPFIYGPTSVEHTQYDDERTYDAASVEYKIVQDAALGMYIDNTPALVMDFEERVNVILEQLPENPADEMIAEYEAAAEELGAVARDLKAKAEELNADYIDAYRDGDKDAMNEIQKDAVALNKISLEAFQKVQDGLVDLNSWYGSVLPHQGLMTNIYNVKAALKYIDAGDFGSAAYDYENGCAAELWAGAEYKAFDFSEETYNLGYDCYNGDSLKERGQTNWGTDNVVPMLNTFQATSLLGDIIYEIQPANDENIAKIKAGYQGVLSQLESMYIEAVSDSIKGIKAVTSYIKDSL